MSRFSDYIGMATGKHKLTPEEHEKLAEQLNKEIDKADVPPSAVIKEFQKKHGIETMDMLRISTIVRQKGKGKK